MQSTNHILAKEGILTSFAIAKKVTEKDIKKLRAKLNTDSLDESEINNLLRDAILEDTEKSLRKDEIPGLIVGGIVEELDEKKKMTELTFFSSIIAKKMKEKNIDKYHSCYIINAIVNMLGLTEEDFDEFHDKFRNNQESDDDGDDSLE